MFIVNKPVMKIGNSIILADIHIGITKDIWEKGVRMPSQSTRLAKRINLIGKEVGAKELVLLGDVKHRIPFPSREEEKEIPEFFSFLKFRKITIIKGNHDGNIERIIPKGIKVKKSISLGRYFLTHGHRHVSTNKKIIVIGHNQPHIKFLDEMGASYIEPVWVKGILNGRYKGKKIIIIPAFNELAGATIVNKDKMLGPIAKCIDKSRTHCYLLDGTDIGTIKDLWID